VWATRRARALDLAAAAPHAEEILSTYADLLDLQARVAEAVPVRRWLTLVSAGESGPPRLRLDRLPVDELVPLFADFLASAADLGTDVMRADAGALSGAPGASWLTLFGTALTADGHDHDAPFHVRAFLQPVATTLAVAEGARMDTARGGRCFVCGGAPVVGALQDLASAQGSRRLLCAVCGSAWRLPRLVCAHCGETDPAKLAVHTAESLPWVRLDECTTCLRYLKTVDLRQRGDAVPLVDDLATVELDLWAREQGLTRVQENLFGL
jgi:formate dehydrogenase accessory protein FdhE